MRNQNFIDAGMRYMIRRYLLLLMLIISIQNSQILGDPLFEARLLTLFKHLFPSQLTLSSIYKASEIGGAVVYCALSEDGVISTVTEEDFHYNLVRLCSEEKKSVLYGVIDQQASFFNDKIKPKCQSKKIFFEAVDARIKTFNTVYAYMRQDFLGSVEQTSKMELAYECSKRVKDLLLIESDGVYRPVADLGSLMMGMFINYFGNNKPDESINEDDKVEERKENKTGVLSYFMSK